MNISKKMWELSNKLEELNKLGSYDVDVFLDDLAYKISQLYFFHNTVLPQANNDISKATYHLRVEPVEHQTIYVSLGRGYPKELYDWHFCYVVKKIGVKYLVVPVTSLKEDSSDPNPDFEMDIDVVGNEKCRMHIDEVRVIDAMRINEKKGYFNVATPIETINTFLGKIIDRTAEVVDKGQSA